VMTYEFHPQRNWKMFLPLVYQGQMMWWLMSFILKGIERCFYPKKKEILRYFLSFILKGIESYGGPSTCFAVYRRFILKGIERILSRFSVLLS